MVGENMADTDTSTAGSNSDEVFSLDLNIDHLCCQFQDKAEAAFSLVKYENPEVIEVEDAEAGEEDGESCEEILNSILPPREVSTEQ